LLRSTLPPVNIIFLNTSVHLPCLGNVANNKIETRNLKRSALPAWDLPSGDLTMNLLKAANKHIKRKRIKLNFNRSTLMKKLL